MQLADLRAALPDSCHRRSSVRALAGLARDVVLYALPISGALLLPNPLLRIACGVVAGVAVGVLFIWGHDAAHGALFTSRRTAKVLGTLAMLPSWQPYALWQHGHNRVHHGFTSLMSIDWIWRPWSPAEHAAASPLARASYRVERSFIGCGWHYLRNVWWRGMVRYQPKALSITAAWVVVATTIAWRLGGAWSVLAAVIIPWLVFTWIIAAVTYLHHTHPTRRFFAARTEWSPVAGHVSGSTIVHLPRPIAWLLHDIFVHTPHHLDQRIPYYRLRTAWHALRPHAEALDVLEYRATPAAVWRTFTACKLFDPATGAWSTFA